MLARQCFTIRSDEACADKEERLKTRQNALYRVHR